MRLDDGELALLKSTVGASHAVDLLGTLGLAIGLRDLGEARRAGRVAAIKIGDAYRYEVEELDRFATAELERRASWPAT